MAAGEQGHYRAMRVGQYRERTRVTCRQWAGRFVRFLEERGVRVVTAVTAGTAEVPGGLPAGSAGAEVAAGGRKLAMDMALADEDTGLLSDTLSGARHIPFPGTHGSNTAVS